MNEIPQWGTPPSATPPAVPGVGGPGWEPAPGTGRFFLVVEQLTGSSDSAVWRADPAPVPAGGSREQARTAALELARTFEPRHPFSPRRRTVYRVSDDALIVVVEGATRTFHFRVNVAELLP